MINLVYDETSHAKKKDHRKKNTLDDPNQATNKATTV